MKFQIYFLIKTPKVLVIIGLANGLLPFLCIIDILMLYFVKN